MMDHIEATVRKVNKGRPNEFERLFLTCPMGHDMGSIPLPQLRNLGANIWTECNHYEHDRKDDGS